LLVFSPPEGADKLSRRVQASIRPRCEHRPVLTSRLRLWRSTAALALLLAGCGGSAKSAAGPATSAATATTAASPATGRRLRGTDYALSLATGWRDTSAKDKTTAAVDRVIAHRNPQAVVVIAMLRAPVHGSRSKLLRDRARRELAGVHATASTRPRPITLDGEQALTYEYRDTSPRGAKVQARQVLAVHRGFLHVIALTASQARFAGADTALGRMLGSWRWSPPAG
jgi:hypothetical protein